MQLRPGTLNHSSERHPFGNLIGDESGMLKSRGMVAEPAPRRGPGDRVPLERKPEFITDNVRAHTKPIWRIVAIQ